MLHRAASELRHWRPLPVDLEAPHDVSSRTSEECGLTLIQLQYTFTFNVVAPANSFSNRAPYRISFRMGGLIAGLIGILIFPWKLLDAYQTWLITYSGLLGAVGGVIACDYVFVRRRVLDLVGLYSEDGSYVYEDSVNRHAVTALVAGVVTALLGLLHPSRAFLFNGAWFSAAIVSFVLYYLLMKPER